MPWLANHVGEVAALGAAACWTLTSLVFAAASRRIGPTAVNVLRITVAWMLLIFIHRLVIGAWIPSPDTRGILLLAASGAVGFAFADQFLFAALVDCGPRLTTVVMTLTPPVAALLAWPMLDEPVGWRGMLGMSVTVAGVAIVAGERPEPLAGQRHAHPHWMRGIVFTMLYCVGQALGLILAKLGIGHTRLPETDLLDPWSASLTRITFGMVAIWTLAMVRRAGKSAAVRLEEPRVASVDSADSADLLIPSESEKLDDHPPGQDRNQRGPEKRVDVAASPLVGQSLVAHRDSSSARFFTASRRDRRFAMRMLMIGAVLGPVVGVWCSLVAVDQTAAGTAFTLMSLTPIFMLPLARWIDREKLSWRAIVGAVVAVGGVAILTSQP